MATTPAEAILIQGSVNHSAPPPGYVRLNNAGPLKNFVDVPVSEILSPNPLNPMPNSVLSFLVDVGAQFRFSSYPAPAPVPLPIVKEVPGPPLQIAGLYGSDGTVLVPNQ